MEAYDRYFLIFSKISFLSFWYFKYIIIILNERHITATIFTVSSVSISLLTVKTVLFGPYYMVRIIWLLTKFDFDVIILYSKFNLKDGHRVGKDWMGLLNKHVFRVRLYALRVMFPILLLRDHEL